LALSAYFASTHGNLETEREEQFRLPRFVHLLEGLSTSREAEPMRCCLSSPTGSRVSPQVPHSLCPSPGVWAMCRK
jgi:hypothetical protein